MKFKYYFLVTTLFFCFIFSACLKDNFNFKKIAGSFWEPDMAVPLVSSSLSLQNILTVSNANNNFLIGPDNFITLVYRGNLFSKRADELFKIPDQTFSSSFVIPTSIVPIFAQAPTQDTIPINPAYSSNINFNVGGGQNSFIDSMTLKSCILTCNFVNNFQQKIRLTLNLPEATKNNLPFSQTIDINPATTVGTTSLANFDLSGYKINLNQGGSPNKLKLTCGVKLVKTTPTIEPGFDNISFSASFTNLAFSRLFGSIGDTVLAPEIDTVAISLFNNGLSQGSISLKNASLGISIANSFGIPIVGTFDKFQGYNPNSPPKDVDSPVLSNPLPIDVPLQIGQLDTSSISLNTANSNVNEVLAIMPKFLIYKINARSNPPTLPFAQNFILDSSRFKVDINVNMPLEGKVKDLLFQDTVNFKFQDVEQLQSLGIKVAIKNGFPIGAKLQIIFADAKGNFVDSLLTDQVVLASATVDGNGKVTAASEKTTEVNYPYEKIQRLGRVAKMYVRAQTSTANDGSSDVKIYSDYRIDVKLSGRAKLKFKI